MLLLDPADGVVAQSVEIGMVQPPSGEADEPMIPVESRLSPSDTLVRLGRKVEDLGVPVGYDADRIGNVVEIGDVQ